MEQRIIEDQLMPLVVPLSKIKLNCDQNHNWQSEDKWRAKSQTAHWESLAPMSLARALYEENKMQMGRKAAET